MIFVHTYKTFKKFIHCVTTLLDCGKKENSPWKIMEFFCSDEKEKKSTLRRLRDITELDGFLNWIHGII